MIRRFLNLLGSLLSLIIIVGLVYFLRNPLWQIYLRLESKFFPCSRPITYSLGNFDKFFNISQKDFLSALNQAESLWEKSVNRNLFESATSGTLTINLVYDYRQEATQKLQKLGITITDDQGTYEALKKKYAGLLDSYNTQKANLDLMIKNFEAEKKGFESQIDFWNKKDGAPDKEYDLLTNKQEELNAEVKKINQAQDNLNFLVDDINAVVNFLNQLAYELNLTVDKYNNIGQQRGEEFQEGEYKSDLKGTEINIYQFDDKASLVRVLEHELGHALGLDHLDDSKAIMYRLNEGRNDKLTDGDIAALKKVCGIK